MGVRNSTNFIGGGGHCTSGPLYYGGILRGGYIKKVVKNHRGEGGDMYLRRGAVHLYQSATVHGWLYRCVKKQGTLE